MKIEIAKEDIWWLREALCVAIDHIEGSPNPDARLGDILENGLMESTNGGTTPAAQIGCDGNTIALSVDGVIRHEVCL